MSARERWVIASSNAHKVAELKTLLEQEGLGDLELTTQSELGIQPPREPATTFVENALIKARHASHISGLPALADDSGLVVAALNGAPGVMSARFAGPDASDRANIEKLLGALADADTANRSACFYCVVVALEHADDPAPIVAAGRWEGTIALRPAGVGGFGYDPVFFDPELKRTAAELPGDVKNAVSHRGRALRLLVAELKAKRTPAPP